MRFKKFIFLGTIVILYILLWTTILPPYLSRLVAENSVPKTLWGGGEQISVGQTVIITVTRAYGPIRLPTYFSSVGNIGHIHDIFFYWFIPILFIIFVILEIRAYGRRKFYGIGFEKNR